MSEAEVEIVVSAVPNIIWDSMNDLAHYDIDLHTIEWALKKLGFIKVEDHDESAPWPIFTYKPPEQINTTKNLVYLAADYSIESDRLPKNLKTLIDELNDNIKSHNYNATALLVRRILTVSSFIAMSKMNRQHELRAASGDLESSAVIEKCRQVFHIPPQVISRVLLAKWIGDSANHSYKLTISSADVYTSITACRLYLSELDLYRKQ